ncbi:MAG: DUF4145 domain-containing protein, partial [Candidatus Hermodarchaeota archaeon]
MKCPHCLVEFHDDPKLTHLDKFTYIIGVSCPSCYKKSVYLVLANSTIGDKKAVDLVGLDSSKVQSGLVRYPSEDDEGDKINFIARVYPKGSFRPPCPKEVPPNIAEDYTEACLVLPDSPKASAALSRRCLQNILREAAKVKPANLYDEIQEVLDSKTLPNYIAESIDAVRNIGNFAAHPNKSTSTGEILPV